MNSLNWKPMMISLACGVWHLAAQGQTVNFDDAASGRPPDGWICTQTGEGEARWTVEQEDTAPSTSQVLRQSGVAAYPLCLKRDSHQPNGFVEVKFKAVSGKKDQAAGVVWRARDANNYYVCRANALENNVVLYKTEAGKRKSLDPVGRPGDYGLKEPVATGQWHTLRVEFSANRFRVLLNGKHLFDVEDNTFTEAGMVGLWTKADSVTRFDDFRWGDLRAKDRSR